MLANVFNKLPSVSGEKESQICLHMRRLSQEGKRSRESEWLSLERGIWRTGPGVWVGHRFSCRIFCSGSKLFHFLYFPLYYVALIYVSSFINYIQVLLSIHVLNISYVYFSVRGKDRCQAQGEHLLPAFLLDTHAPPSEVPPTITLSVTSQRLSCPPVCPALRPSPDSELQPLGSSWAICMVNKGQAILLGPHVWESLPSVRASEFKFKRRPGGFLACVVPFSFQPNAFCLAEARKGSTALGPACVHCGYHTADPGQPASWHPCPLSSAFSKDKRDSLFVIVWNVNKKRGVHHLTLCIHFVVILLS